MCMRTFMFVHVHLCPYVSMHEHVLCIPLYLRPFAVHLCRRCEGGSPVKACLSDILSIWGSASSLKAWYKSSRLLRIKSPPAAAASVTACCLYQATKRPGSSPSGGKLTRHKVFFSNISLWFFFSSSVLRNKECSHLILHHSFTLSLISIYPLLDIEPANIPPAPLLCI